MKLKYFRLYESEAKRYLYLWTCGEYYGRAGAIKQDGVWRLGGTISRIDCVAQDVDFLLAVVRLKDCPRILLDRIRLCEGNEEIRK